MRSALSLLIVLSFFGCGQYSNPEVTGTNSNQMEEIQESIRVKVPGGLFLFGASEQQFELYLSGLQFNYPGLIEKLRQDMIIPVRPMDLPEFEIDEFEVTNQQFYQFMKATGYSPEDREGFLKHWESNPKPPEWALDFPVIWVSQIDAEAYCEWSDGRLPTEQEWEKAARGASGQIYPWGNTDPESATTNKSGQLEPVGNRPDDRSPYQVYDLGGNVSELTSSTVNRRGTENAVVKGGNYRSSFKEALVYARNVYNPVNGRNELTGFRCAAD